MAINKRQIITSADKDGETGFPHALLVGMFAVPQKAEYKVTV